MRCRFPESKLGGLNAASSQPSFLIILWFFAVSPVPITQLRTAGIDPVAEAFYRDHHAYTAQDIRDLLRLRERSEAGGFVTTEKDAINLGTNLSALHPIAIVPVKMELLDASNVLETILQTIEERRRPA